jgi:hypothetical protein
MTQIIGHNDFEFDVKSIGKSLRQFIFKTCQGIAFDIVAGQAISG